MGPVGLDRKFGDNEPGFTGFGTLQGVGFLA
jgi:hypothetical protein